MNRLIPFIAVISFLSSGVLAAGTTDKDYYRQLHEQEERRTIKVEVYYENLTSMIEATARFAHKAMKHAPGGVRYKFYFVTGPRTSMSSIRLRKAPHFSQFGAHIDAGGKRAREQKVGQFPAAVIRYQGRKWVLPLDRADDAVVRLIKHRSKGSAQR